LAEAGAAEAASAVQWPATEGQVVRMAAARRERVTPPPGFGQWLADVQESAKASRWKPTMSASGLEGTDPDVEAVAPWGIRTDDVLGNTSTEDIDQLEHESLAAGLAKGARDVEQPAWAKGRYGSAIGRAVHGTLQTVDLRTSEGLADTVAAQCLAEGVLDFEPLVTALVQSAVDSDVVRRAAYSEHWRESYVGLEQEDGTILEGFVDLIYRAEDDSLMLVDYKTDDVPEGALPSRLAFYGPQLSAYRQMAAASTGTDISGTLLFLGERSATSVTTPPPARPHG
jgi:ATP-dependent exoDNAse (exonuclease V) beta subunit